MHPAFIINLNNLIVDIEHILSCLCRAVYNTCIYNPTQIMSEPSRVSALASTIILKVIASFIIVVYQTGTKIT